MTARRCGRLLRTDDGGRTWNDDAVCMDFPSGDVTCYEQRLCQLASGTIVCILSLIHISRTFMRLLLSLCAVGVVAGADA